MASLPEKSSTLISSSHTRRGERATWMRCVSSCFGCAGAMGGDHGEIIVLGGVLLRGLSRSIGECYAYLTLPAQPIIARRWTEGSRSSIFGLLALWWLGWLLDFPPAFTVRGEDSWLLFSCRAGRREGVGVDKID